MKTTFFTVSVLSIASNATRLLNGPLIGTNIYGTDENDGLLIEVNVYIDGDNSGPLVETNVYGSGNNFEPLVELNVYDGSDNESSSESEDGYCDNIDPWEECEALTADGLNIIFEFFDTDGDGVWEICEFYKGIVCTCEIYDSQESCLVPYPQENQEEVFDLFM